MKDFYRQKGVKERENGSVESLKGRWRWRCLFEDRLHAAKQEPAAVTMLMGWRDLLVFTPRSRAKIRAPLIRQRGLKGVREGRGGLLPGGWAVSGEVL